VFVPRESTWNYWYDPTPWKVEYQWTPSPKMMVNAMWGDSSYMAQWRPQEGSDVPGNPMTNDINTGFTTGPAAVAKNPNKNHQLNASMNFFPERSMAGRHELKVGFQYYISVYGVDYYDLASGNYIRIFDSSKPRQLADVAQNAADYTYQLRTEDRPVTADSKLDNPNLFFVDTWRVNNRLTTTLGFRYEHHNLISRGGVKEASQFGEAGTFGDMDILKWNGFAPRLGASWDLTGSGKTVLKGQYARYLHMAAANYGSSFNPATVTVNRYLWNDNNHNLLYDAGELGTFVDSAQRSSASGISTTPRPMVNPDLKQAHTDEASMTFEQELVNNMAFRSLLLYKRVSGDYGNVQVLRPYEVWNIPITRVDPGPDGDALTVADNGDLVTFYDYQAAYKGAQFEPTQPQNRDSSRNDSYKGFEMTVTKRQSSGWMALGSFQVVKNHIWTGSSATPSNPNQEIFAVDNTWDWSGKLMGSYRAPYDINVSALYNFLAGTPRQRTYQFRSVPNATSVTIPLEEWGASRDPNQHVVNVKAARSFRFDAQRRLQLSFDVYNLFNVNTATTTRYVSSATYGAISAILPPRIARVGVEFSF
jgi:outer membrane receptor protein involved in Fe transport